MWEGEAGRWGKPEERGDSKEMVSCRYNRTDTCMNSETVVEHILLLQPKPFKMPAHLGVVSYTVKATVKSAPSLLLLAQKTVI